MDTQSRLMEKMKWGICLFCREKTLKGELSSCSYANCPMYDMCPKCLEIHEKGHLKENSPMDDEVIELLNSLNGIIHTRKGNNMGLF